MRKYPASLVVVAFETPIRLSVIVTLAPASAAPEVSRAVPSMPLENWAKAGTPLSANRNRNNGKNLFRFLALAMMCLLAANVQIVIVDLPEVVTGSANFRAPKRINTSRLATRVVLTVSDRFLLNAVKRFLLRSNWVLAYPLLPQTVCQFDSSPKTWSGKLTGRSDTSSRLVIARFLAHARVRRISAPEVEFRRVSLLIHSIVLQQSCKPIDGRVLVKET